MFDKCSTNIQTYMISTKFTIRKKPNKDGKHTIVMTLVKDRKNTLVSTKYSCDFEDWSFEADRLKTSSKKHKIINGFIGKTNKKVEDFIDERIKLDEDYSLSEIINEIKREETKSITYDYFGFHQEIRDEFYASEKIGTADIYKETLQSLQKFWKSDTLKFTQLNFEFLQKYESFLRSNGGTDSGISIRMRTIRAVLNKAIMRKRIPERIYPFKDYKIAKLKNEAKRDYLSEIEIGLLLKIDVSNNLKLQFAKDMYLFSFYCRGMNFIDISCLVNSNISDNIMSYTRIKTGVHLEFELTPISIKILGFYKSRSFADYLHPILREKSLTKIQIKNREEKILKEVNKSLKEIANLIGVNKNITFYTARHSFATYLKFNGVPIDAISEMLGHTDIKTTQAYLNKLPNKKLDKIANDVFKNSKYL